MLEMRRCRARHDHRGASSVGQGAAEALLPLLRPVPGDDRPAAPAGGPLRVFRLTRRGGSAGRCNVPRVRPASRRARRRRPVGEARSPRSCAAVGCAARMASARSTRTELEPGATISFHELAQAQPQRWQGSARPRLRPRPSHAHPAARTVVNSALKSSCERIATKRSDSMRRRPLRTFLTAEPRLS